MNAVMHNDYIEGLFGSLAHDSNESSNGLKQLRAQAIDCADQLRFPTLKDEEWRFTDISPLAKFPYKPAQKIDSLGMADIQPYCLNETVNRLVFVDGFFSPALSQLNDHSYPAGNLPLMATNQIATAAAHLGQYAKYQDNIFTALNTAFIQDCALIIVPENIAISHPVHLLFIATQENTTSYPRCMVIGEKNSQITVIEDYVALDHNAYITNTVAEFALAANTQVTHIRVQRESDQAYHLANCAVSLEHASRYHSVGITFGAITSRFNLDAAFKAEAAECTVDGLTLISSKQLADTHTFIDHAKANCTSRQQHKCIVDGNAHAVFNGKIMVRPQAQQTNSSQSSRNLLLSDKAQVDTKPQLEIFADDVKCAHGATVGQLDSDELFYLKSRGLPESTARNLLTYAFGAEILHRIPVPSLKQNLEKAVLTQMHNK